MPIRCVIFDIDGTMADTLPICVMAFQKTLKGVNGINYQPEEITRYFSLAEGGILSKFVNDDEFPNTLTVYYRELEGLHRENNPVLPGITDLLEELSSRNIPMGVVTGKGRISAELTLKAMDLLKYFPYVEYGSDHAADKSIGLRRILSGYNIDPHEAVYIGDMESDILDAQKVGMFAAGAAWASTATLQKEDRGEGVEIFSTVNDFRNWLFEQLE
ncbi:MAG TPA: HAD hydrolase-like protein [Anaerovoracaceae bacterium]|nr:HAD hydrolase-like protein [Anaerovoracaceae bacterium]